MTTKLNKLPLSERPYEKLEMYGEEKLSDSELLAIIIKTGTRKDTAVDLAQKILLLNETQNDNLRFLQDISIEDLKKIKGIGRVKAIQLKAICEIAKRMSKPLNKKRIIKGTEDVADLLIEELRYEKRENVKVLILNTKNVLQKIVHITTGSTSFANIEPKDILQDAIKLGSNKIILVHNHPSGDPTPSLQDIEITKRIEDAANLLGVKLLDHVIIGDGKYNSIFSINKSKKRE